MRAGALALAVQRRDELGEHHLCGSAPSARARRCVNATHARSHAVLVPDLGAEHISDSLLISERDFIPLLHKVEGGVADEFEAYARYDGVLHRRVEETVPVKHSTNLNPSALAIASTILELTVEATIANLSTQGELHQVRSVLLHAPLHSPRGFPDALCFWNTALAKSAPSWSPVNVIHLPSGLPSGVNRRGVL